MVQLCVWEKRRGRNETNQRASIHPVTVANLACNRLPLVHDPSPQEPGPVGEPLQVGCCPGRFARLGPLLPLGLAPQCCLRRPGLWHLGFVHLRQRSLALQPHHQQARCPPTRVRVNLSTCQRVLSSICVLAFFFSFSLCLSYHVWIQPTHSRISFFFLFPCLRFTGSTTPAPPSSCTSSRTLSTAGLTS